MSDSDTRYVVRRLGWHQAPHGDPYTRRLPTAEAVARFDNFDDAEYHRRALEAEARADENPFRFGGAALHFQSSLDIPRLHDWLLDIGIDPPVEQLRHNDWRVWWDAFSHTWNEEQLHHAWQGLNKVQFFDVVEEPNEPPLHMVTEIGFIERQTLVQVAEAEREGGRLHGLYRSERTARTQCDRLNIARQDATNQWLRFGYGFRRGYSEERRRGREVVYFELAEVPGNVPRHSGVAFLVLRRAFDMNGFVCHTEDSRDTGSRVPLRAFYDRDMAVEHRDELLAAAHAVMNPFQVYPPVLAGLGERQFVDAVEALQPPLPWPNSFRPGPWCEWWDLCQDEATPEQRAAAWELFDAHPLFEVLTVEVREG
ncbi:MAG: hypothetical protein U0792_23235 [Gemmataceae bacterium]